MHAKRAQPLSSVSAYARVAAGNRSMRARGLWLSSPLQLEGATPRAGCTIPVPGVAPPAQRHPSAQVSVIGSCGGLSKSEVFWGAAYLRRPEVLCDELGYGIEAGTGEVRGDAFRAPFLPGADPLKSG